MTINELHMAILSVHTHVCGLRHLTADLRQQFFPTF